MVSKLYAAHQEGQKSAGFDVEGDGAAVKDVVKAGILDLYSAKWWGLKLATTAATTVLRVDQVGISNLVSILPRVSVILPSPSSLSLPLPFLYTNGSRLYYY